MTLAWRFAAASDVGLLRDGNEDSGYAGPHLIAVADGMGGHAAGEVASAAAIAAIATLDAPPDGAEADLEARLRRGFDAANATLRAMVAADDELTGMGTTVTAAVAGGDRVVLAHIGDSRGYLLRDGELTQITHDHTFVQQLLDEGRIDARAAAGHPKRSMLTRTLDGRQDAVPDLLTLDVRPGDRVLLCSDGLSGIVSAETMAEVLGRGTPELAVVELVELALRGGAPDNVTCVVGDAVEVPADPADPPLVVGAAAGSLPTPRLVAAPPPGETRSSPATRAAARIEAGERQRRTRTLRRRRGLLAALVAAALLVAGAAAGWAYVRSQFYVGVADGNVAVYRGVDGSLGPLDLSSLERRTDVRVDALPAYLREDVMDGIAAGSRADADAIVARLSGSATPAPAPSPTPSPEASP